MKHKQEATGLQVTREGITVFPTDGHPPGGFEVPGDGRNRIPTIATPAADQPGDPRARNAWGVGTHSTPDCTYERQVPPPSPL
jgi:hypothetical protein